MDRRHLACAVGTALALLAAAVAAAPAAATGDGAQTGASAAATSYLEARAAAVTAADPAAALRSWTRPGSAVASTEAMVARGAGRLARRQGHAIESVACDVTALDVVPSTDGASATATAHVVTTTTWSAPSGAVDTEATGVDHSLALHLEAGGWQVVSDAYTDVQTPAYLQAAGASASRVRRAGRALERVSPEFPPVQQAVLAGKASRDYTDIITYDRPAAQTYADKYALAYNPTYVRFGADCADFASQCARAGDMPQSAGSWDSGWWYTKAGTSSPSDDSYSLSWINVTKQMGYWDGRRTDWETSAGVLSRGDFIYYDWTGDGFWDHVVTVAGTNSAGQKVIDGHTTDMYHVFWKMGTSSTKYRFAKTRTQWVI